MTLFNFSTPVTIRNEALKNRVLTIGIKRKFQEYIEKNGILGIAPFKAFLKKNAILAFAIKRFSKGSDRLNHYK
jgi:hypothetical protein